MQTENVYVSDMEVSVTKRVCYRRAYFHSSATINYIRALLTSGFADLHNPRSWSLTHVRNPELAKSFESIIDRLEDSLDFLKVIGGESGSSLRSVDLYTSHEVGPIVASFAMCSADLDYLADEYVLHRV